MEISSTNPVKVQSAPRPAAAAAPSATQASPAAAPATPAASVELQGRDLSQASGSKADPAQPQGAQGGAQADGAHEPPSGLKSFGYGALGVSAPKDQPASNEDAYSAGQWAGAALKVGGIIAILA